MFQYFYKKVLFASSYQSCPRMRRFASLTAGANSGSSCWRAACSDVPDCGGRENGCILNTIAVKVINSKLITRLSSWFSIHGSVLSWFKSYLSSRSFRVKCHDNLSSFHTSSCGVPQWSVLGPILFVMYTTPLSMHSISSLSLDHHLYADDTQLFSFHPLNFDSSISHF